MNKHIDADKLLNHLNNLINLEKLGISMGTATNAIIHIKEIIEESSGEDVISTEIVVRYLCDNCSNSICNFCDTHLLSFCNKDSWDYDRKHCNDAARKMLKELEK